MLDFMPSQDSYVVIGMGLIYSVSPSDLLTIYLVFLPLDYTDVSTVNTNAPELLNNSNSLKGMSDAMSERQLSS